MDPVVVTGDGKDSLASLRRAMRQILSSSPYSREQGRQDIALVLVNRGVQKTWLETPLQIPD